MAGISVVLRLALAGVFALAGATKLRNRPGTERAAVDFGARPRLAPFLAVALPVAELTLAALLLPSPTASAGAAGALVLLLLFSVAIAVSLARGRTPDCHCFGQLHSSPAGWKTLTRNGALTVLAAVALAGALAGDRPSAVAWLGRLDATQSIVLGASLVVTVLLVLGGAVIVSLLRSYGRVLVRLERVEHVLEENGLSVEEDEQQLGLVPGTSAPSFEGLDPLLERGLPVLLLFTSVRCGPCRELLPEAAAWQVEHGDILTVAFATEGTPDEIRAEAAEHELEHVLADEHLELYTAFGAVGTPGAVLIAPDGTVSSWLATGADRIRRLVAVAVQPEPGLPVGSGLPELALPALDGTVVDLDGLRGRRTVLVFWNPDCGFCRAMHDDLVARERTTNGGGPRLVVVSSGDAESSRGEGFESLVLLDRGFSAGMAFGATGTPSGVLIDETGLVASKVAVGADAILALTKRHD
jgi:thiol-disulfide isomerase/thioredoxin